MGVLERIRTMLVAQANAAIDRATAPAHEVAAAIADLEDALRAVHGELVAYKAAERLAADKARALAERASGWQTRAEQAVKAGEDDLARDALRERARAEGERAELEAERREHAATAAELLRARRELQQRLQGFRLRQGTITQNLAAARGRSALAAEGESWDALARVEAGIEDDAALAELDGELGMADELAVQQVRELGRQARAEEELAALKQRMLAGAAPPALGDRGAEEPPTSSTAVVEDDRADRGHGGAPVDRGGLAEDATRSSDEEVEAAPAPSPAADSPKKEPTP